LRLNGHVSDTNKRTGGDASRRPSAAPQTL
jgi:hypothetical protein